MPQLPRCGGWGASAVHRGGDGDTSTDMSNQRKKGIMGSWGTVAVCDEHWREDHGDKKPTRAVGRREHCHIGGCDKTGDIFIRAYIGTEEEGLMETCFTSDLHALAMGMLVAKLADAGLNPDIITDDNDNYTPTMVCSIVMFGDVIKVRLNIGLIDDE